MTKERSSVFGGGKGVTLSVTAPGDTNLINDAIRMGVNLVLSILVSSCVVINAKLTDFISTRRNHIVVDHDLLMQNRI